MFWPFRRKSSTPAPGILTRDQYLALDLVTDPDDTCCSPSSYELRIGSYYDLSDRTRREMYDGSAVTVQGGGILHLGTIERVSLPLDVMALMYLRSTYARRGCLSWFQGLVDPGFKGNLTVVLHNLTKDAVTFEQGERVCHIVFHRLAEAASKPYAGVYQNNRGAVAGPPSGEPASFAPLLVPAFELLTNPKIIEALKNLGAA